MGDQKLHSASFFDWGQAELSTTNNATRTRADFFRFGSNVVQVRSSKNSEFVFLAEGRTYIAACMHIHSTLEANIHVLIPICGRTFLSK